MACDRTTADFDCANAKMIEADPKLKRPKVTIWNHVGPDGSTELELLESEFHERISHKGPGVWFMGAHSEVGRDNVSMLSSQNKMCLIKYWQANIGRQILAGSSFSSCGQSELWRL